MDWQIRSVEFRHGTVCCGEFWQMRWGGQRWRKEGDGLFWKGRYGTDRKATVRMVLECFGSCVAERCWMERLGMLRRGTADMDCYGMGGQVRTGGFRIGKADVDSSVEHWRALARLVGEGFVTADSDSIGRESKGWQRLEQDCTGLKRFRSAW